MFFIFFYFYHEYNRTSVQNNLIKISAFYKWFFNVYLQVMIFAFSSLQPAQFYKLRLAISVMYLQIL